MNLPSRSQTLNAEQIAELDQQLSTLRHDVNNHLSLILAAVELMRAKPESTSRMLGTLADQPAKITASLQKFSAEFEAASGIRRS